MLTLVVSGVDAQCFCADIQFRIVLPGIKKVADSSNYSLHIAYPQKWYRDRTNFFENEISGDTVVLNIPTDGGIPVLRFIITEPLNKKKMEVTVTHLTYDNPYFIDLTEFAEGRYFFDFRIINDCQHKYRDDTLIYCGGKQVIQLQPGGVKGHSFVYNKIRPVRLREFRQLE